MNAQNFWLGVKELRTTIIVVIVFVILFGLYHLFCNNQAKQLQTQIAQQEKTISELKKALETPAQGHVFYVDKPVKAIKYIPYYITQSVLPPTPVTIAKDDLCKIADQNNIALKVAIENKSIYCQTDFCDPSESIILLKAAALAAIANIENHKQGVFRLSGVAGYDAVHSNFTLGVSLLDWYDLIAGVNAGFNFKLLSDTDAGMFIGYRPQLWGKEINASVFAGPTYSIKGWGGQCGIQFHWYN